MSLPDSLVIASNTSWSVVNFRSDLIKELRERGFRVQVIAAPDRFSERLASMGASFHPIDIDGRGTSPLRDAALFAAYFRTLSRLKPRAYLGFTVKPNIYGSIAAQLLGIPVINNIAGLGTAFVTRTWLTPVVTTLYRIALARAQQIFFQNEDDLEMFRTLGLAGENRAALLPGSGINLERFAPMPAAPAADGTFCFLLHGRLLWDKGVGIYVEAARLLRPQHPHVRFRLLGPVGTDRNEITRETIDTWSYEGLIEYLGEADDVRPHIAAADCVVLPSHYREGVPRSLLEAAAMAKPIITTTMPGCRDAVDEDRSGYLCHPRDPNALAQKMMQMISTSPETRAAMGVAGRVKMEGQFDQRVVTARYLDRLQEIDAYKGHVRSQRGATSRKFPA